MAYVTREVTVSVGMCELVVSPQLRRRRERHVALATFERRLASVTSHVHAQSELIEQHRAADRALDAFLRLGRVRVVNSVHVFLQIKFVQEEAVTELAAVHSRVAVRVSDV